MRAIFLKLKQFIIQLNLFNDHSGDPLRIRRNRIASRLYILLSIGTISVLITYTSIPIQTISKNTPPPSQEQYKNLQTQYPDTLRCPCSVVSIPHKEFIEVTPTYHQLCSSNFVQQRWYESIRSMEGDGSDTHLLYSGSAHFRTLAMFCEIASLTIITEIDRFSSMMFINSQVMTAELFSHQMDTLIDTLINSTQAEFLFTLSMINAVLQANQYVSIWQGNVALETRNFFSIDRFMVKPLRVIAFSEKGKTETDQICYCARNAACNLHSLMDDFGLTIEGVPSASCSILDSVFASTLTCWYDATCFSRVQYDFEGSGVPITENTTLLNLNLPSRFPPNTSIKEIVENVMVERWDQSISYERFYQKCRPTHCSYTYQETSNIMYVVTTVIGLFGGLDVIFKLLSPIVVKIFFKYFSRTDSNNASQASNNQQATDRKLNISFHCKKKRIVPKI